MSRLVVNQIQAKTGSEIEIPSGHTIRNNGTAVGFGLSTATDTLPSEGGAATTIVAQGLSKLFVKFNGAGTTVNESFNTGSITDSGTGYHRVNFTNNMNSIHYVTHSTTAHNYGVSNNGWSSGVASDNGTNGMTTSTVQLSHGASGGSNADPTAVHVSLDGDLA